MTIDKDDSDAAYSEVDVLALGGEPYDPTNDEEDVGIFSDDDDGESDLPAP